MKDLSSDNQADVSFLLDNIYIRVGTKLYRQIVGIPIGYKLCPSCS